MQSKTSLADVILEIVFYQLVGSATKSPCISEFFEAWWSIWKWDVSLLKLKTVVFCRFSFQQHLGS